MKLNEIRDNAGARKGRMRVGRDIGSGKKLDIKGVVDHAALKAAGVARGGKDGVRILAKGALTAKINLRVAGASAAAKAAVEKAGGSVDVIHVVPAAEKAAAKKNTVKLRTKA